MYEFNPPTMRLGEMPDGQPLFEIPPVRVGYSGIVAVKRVIEYLDPLHVGTIENDRSTLHYEVTDTGSDHSVTAQLDEETGKTNVSIERPDNNPRLIIGMFALNREGQQGLVADIQGRGVTSRLPRGSQFARQESETSAPDLSEEEAARLQAYESDPELGSSPELEELVATQARQPQSPLYAVSNRRHPEGSGRVLTVSRFRADLPELVETMAVAASRIVDLPGRPSVAYEWAQSETARMFGVSRIADIRAAWNIGTGRMRRTTAAIAVLEELSKFPRR